VRADLETALETTRLAGTQGVDQICCGSMGRADILLTAGRSLGRIELEDDARALAGQVLARAAVSGRYRLQANLPVGTYSPGLFQGTAGIGYTCLRLAEPELVPSVLCWS
jgi:lantibiotic modifying enzyme